MDNGANGYNIDDVRGCGGGRPSGGMNEGRCSISAAAAATPAAACVAVAAAAQAVDLKMEEGRPGRGKKMRVGSDRGRKGEENLHIAVLGGRRLAESSICECAVDLKSFNRGVILRSAV